MADQPFFCMRQSDFDAPGDKPLVRALLALDGALESSDINVDDAAAVEALVRDGADANADLCYFSDAVIDFDALFQLLYEENNAFSRGERLPLAERAVFALARARGASLCTATRVLLQYIQEPRVTVANIAWLVARGANIRAGGDFGVRQAAANGHLSVVQWFVERGADKEAAVRWAAMKGRLATVQWLVERGADIRADGEFAVRQAAANGHLAVVQWLVERGANIRADGDLAVQFAAKNGELAMVQWLVERGADIRANGDFAVQRAAANGHLAMVQWLVERGADIRAGGDLAMQFAAAYGHLVVVQWLVERGADIRADHDYAVQLAAANGHLAVVQWLVERGADVNTIDNAASNVQQWLDERSSTKQQRVMRVVM